MPKKPTRLNPTVRDRRTVQDAATVLQRINQRIGGVAANMSTGADLLTRLRSRLPPDLADHVVEALEKPDELVCFVDSATWAGRIRLAAAEDSELTGGRRLVLKVMPGRPRRHPEEPR